MPEIKLIIMLTISGGALYYLIKMWLHGYNFIRCWEDYRYGDGKWHPFSPGALHLIFFYSAPNICRTHQKKYLSALMRFLFLLSCAGAFVFLSNQY